MSFYSKQHQYTIINMLTDSDASDVSLSSAEEDKEEKAPTFIVTMEGIDDQYFKVGVYIFLRNQLFNFSLSLSQNYYPLNFKYFVLPNYLLLRKPSLFNSFFLL